MEMIGAIICGKGVGLACQFEFSFCNTVAVSTDDGAEIGLRLMHIFADAVIAQHDIGQYAFFVGDQQADQTGAIIGDGGLYIMFVPKDKKTGGLMVHAVLKEGAVGYGGTGGWYYGIFT